MQSYKGHCPLKIEPMNTQLKIQRKATFAQTSYLTPAGSGILQRKCTCGNHTVAGGECAECHKKRLQRMATHQGEPGTAPPIVHEVLHSPGQPLDSTIRAFMQPRSRHDFSQARIHTDRKAAESAQAVQALAYAVRNNVVFGAEQYKPSTASGQHLIAHELTHVLQQGLTDLSGSEIHHAGDSPSAEQNAESVADAVLADRPIGTIAQHTPAIQRRAAPYIKKITVHLTPPQTADLDWKGTPPADAPGSDHFTVSTGKGYSDPGDPRGTCTRSCCHDANTQCAPPWNRPTRVGACCTFYGNTFWTGRPRTEHNGWKWWTPIQPHYSSRGIALHQHHEVTGQPIGHGCVRMEEANAKRIYDFSNRRRTNVTVVGRAAPVLCEPNRQCSPSGGTGATKSTQGALNQSSDDSQLALEINDAVPGLEGVMS